MLHKRVTPHKKFFLFEYIRKFDYKEIISTQNVQNNWTSCSLDARHSKHLFCSLEQIVEIYINHRKTLRDQPSNNAINLLIPKMIFCVSIIWIDVEYVTIRNRYRNIRLIPYDHTIYPYICRSIYDDTFIF